MIEDYKAPVCNITSVIMQALGISCSFLFAHRLYEALGPFIEIGVLFLGYGFCTFVGFFCALGAFSRSERWPVLSWFGLIVNLVPFLWLLYLFLCFALHIPH
jgi:hypothetical protein